jgi:hypothetical protein
MKRGRSRATLAKRVDEVASVPQRTLAAETNPPARARLRGGARARPGWPDRGASQGCRHLGQNVAGWHHQPGDARCSARLPGCVHHRQPGSAPSAANPAGAGNRARGRPERAPAGCPAPGAGGDAGAGRHLEPGGVVRVARHRAPTQRPRVGDPPGMGRPGRSAGAGARYPGGGAWCARGGVSLDERALPSP